MGYWFVLFVCFNERLNWYVKNGCFLKKMVGCLWFEVKVGFDDVKCVLIKLGYIEIFSICVCIFGLNF